MKGKAGANGIFSEFVTLLASMNCPGKIGCIYY
jgi:hypothetical protein